MMSCLYLGRLKHPSQMLRNSRVAGLKYLSEKNISQSSFPHACFSKKNGFKFLGIKQAYMSTDHKNDITEKDNNIDKSTQNSNVDNGINSIPPQDFYNQEEELDKEFLDIAAAALSENGIENIFVPNDVSNSLILFILVSQYLMIYGNIETSYLGIFVKGYRFTY